MRGRKITVGGLEVPYSVGDEYYSIIEPDKQIRYDDHFSFKVVGPDTVEGILIDESGINVRKDEDVFVPIIEIFPTKKAAEEFIRSLAIDKLPFKEKDAVITPNGEDSIACLSIDYDRRKLIIQTDKGHNFTLEEWGDTVTKPE